MGESNRTMDAEPVIRSLVTALVHDARVPAGLFDLETGIAQDLNHLFRDQLAARSIDAARYTVDSDLPAALTDERREIIQRVTATSEPESLLGMTRGTLTTTSYRLLECTSGKRALLVSRAPINERNSEGSKSTPRAKHDDLGPLAGLTAREFEVLRYIGLGLSSEAIATELHRSAKTVQGHRLSLGLKLGVSNRVELARLAVLSGLTALAHNDALELWRQGRT